MIKNTINLQEGHIICSVAHIYQSIINKFIIKV